MRTASVLAALLGGFALGATIGLLFAPEKGEDLRAKIAEAIRARGIKLNREEMENLVDDITEELKAAQD
ncbi:MAG: YtxH domain-containing protein [Bacteroidaceae bacterium]|jgi:gas vesicle protein|nr:YtxH domain-containing protein [Bacteroidaceae bacterium]MBQ2030435.1 YtxH domain-containing protein [Bacteroidaceae bacterium]